MSALTDLRNARPRLVAENEPLTAAKVHAHAPHLSGYDWVESLHPRNPNTGEFIDKGTSVAKLGKPIKINTKVIYSTKYEHGQVVAVRKTPHGATQELRWNAHEKAPGSAAAGRFEVWSDYGAGGTPLKQSQILGKGQAYSSLKNDSGWHSPAKPTIAGPSNSQLLDETSTGDEGLPQNEAEAIDAVKSMTGPEYALWIEDHADEIDSMWPTLSSAEKDTLLDKAKSLQTDPWSHGFKSGDYSYLTPYSTLVDIKLKHDENPVKYAIPEAPQPGGAPTIAQQIDPLGKDHFQTWLYDNIYPESWQSLHPDDRQHIRDWAKVHGIEHVLDDLLVGGSGNVDEQGQLLSALGTNEFVDDVHWLTNLHKNQVTKPMVESIIDSVTPENWKALDSNTQVEIGDIALEHGVAGDLFNKIAGNGVPSTPAPTVPNLKYDTSKIKSVADIGTPKTEVPDQGYETLTKESAHQLQQDMLKTSGKKWTATEKAAISTYTTSVGYQTTNAVLRNDEKRMKMFNDAQLQGGLKRAVDLQSAMTPLTKSVVLHRGVGAQAFGFPDTDVSFGELKKLEGKTVTDPGFISTSVVEPTAHGVSFDYATKKPIKMIVRTPEGTPAVYVSSATPGYSHENELILGAGTTLRLDSIKPATAAEKKKYGPQIEHVVIATVVPTPAKKTPTPKISQPKTTTPNGPSLTNGGIGTGKPIKLNTAVVHTAKYQDGEVVAVRTTATGTGSVQQIFWDAQKKKYGVRLGDAGGNWHLAKAYYSKKALYDTFKNDTDWKTPHPGSKIADEASPGGGASTTTVKVPKLSAADIQNQHGVVPMLADEHAIEFVKNVKADGPLGAVKIGTTAPTIFKAVAWAVAKHNNDHPNAPRLNLLQGIKLLDSKSAPKGQNSSLYEKKVVDWLQTAGGKKNAQSFVDWAQAEIAKIPAGKKYVSVDFKTAYELGTPDNSVTKFGDIGPAAAAKMNIEMRAQHGQLTSEQRGAIESYTGTGYTSVNQSMRKGTPSQRAVLVQSTMAPLPRSFTVHRGTDGVGDAIKSLASFDELKTMIGKTVSDPAILSTSVGPEAAFTYKTFGLDIDVPVGTPGIYVQSYSNHSGERELLLAGGLKYKILDIVPGKSIDRPFTWVIKMRVVA